MSMLADSKKKSSLSWVLTPKESSWSSSNAAGFGKNLMRKMGWNEGQGLGASETGNVDFIKIAFKNNNRGLGCDAKTADHLSDSHGDFNSLLADLAANHSAIQNTECISSGRTPGQSLEVISKSSKRRVHYHKFTRSKDISKATKNDLNKIMGIRMCDNLSKPISADEHCDDNAQIEKDSFEDINTRQSDLNMQEYFKNKSNFTLNQNCLNSGLDIVDEDTACLAVKDVAPTSKRKRPKIIKSEINDDVVHVSDTAEVSASRKNSRKSKCKNRDRAELEKTENPKIKSVSITCSKKVALGGDHDIKKKRKKSKWLYIMTHLTGLEDIGIPGCKHLKETLTNCNDPLKAIEEFQAENGILLSSLQPAMPLLDLHDIPRMEFHNYVFEQLKAKLMEKIETLSNDSKLKKPEMKKLNDLLEKSLPVIKMPTLRPIVFHLLKHIPSLPVDVINKLFSDKTLYEECSLEVKQQIWKHNQGLFGDEISPILTEFITVKEDHLFTMDSSQPFFSLTSKARRQDERIKKLTQMIGSHVRLYDMVLQFLRTLFLRTRNVNYCSLRSVLLMAFHELEINDICSVDPCYKFTWCLNACIREKNVDSKRARELRLFLDGIRKGEEMVLGDLAMILCDPHAIHATSVSFIRFLSQCIQSDSLPRDCDEIVFLLRMISLGLGAWDMIDNQVFKEPKLNQDLITKFLPGLTSLMLDDRIRMADFRIQNELAKDGVGEPKPDMPAPKLPASSLPGLIRKHKIAGLITFHYCLYAWKSDVTRHIVSKLLPVLIESQLEIWQHDSLINCLISTLLSTPLEFKVESTCQYVLDDFFLRSSSGAENVMRHVFRLLWFLCPIMPKQYLMSVLVVLKPSSEHSQIVHQSYKMLKSKFDSGVELTETSTTDID